MALTEYRQKRKFSRTPEPSGQETEAPVKKPKAKKRAGRELRFVVQKHDASRLHYDFRLELGGVLVSWAVPKGPSCDPANKRLAMKVEDHPLDYRHFEGVIPKGNYGAGNVIIWDEGVYHVDPAFSREENERAVREGLEAGEVKITLEGQKLKGSFVLIHIRDRDPGDKGNAWLLIKHQDTHASDREILLEDRSVRSGKRIQEIEAVNREKEEEETEPVKDSSPPVSTSAISMPSQAKKADMPHDIAPMLSTLVDEPFDREGWFFEPKLDGYRAIAELREGQVRLYSRHSLPFERKFPGVVRQMERWTGDMILDGEVVALNDQGIPSFQMLQDAESHSERLVYYLFDLLYYNGYDLRDLPLSARKDFLRQVFQANTGESPGAIRLCSHVERRGRDLFEAVRKQGLEGMMAKDAASPYRTGKRTSDWLKMKIRQRQEGIICGFTAPRGGRKRFGALILGVYEGERLIYIGHTGTGLTEHMLETVERLLKPLIVPDCPFAQKPRTNQKATWVRPELVCEIHFTEWTQDGHARHPSFMGLRPDKRASEVVRESGQKTENAIAEAEVHEKTTESPAMENATSKKPTSKNLSRENQRRKSTASKNSSRENPSRENRTEESPGTDTAVKTSRFKKEAPPRKKSSTQQATPGEARKKFGPEPPASRDWIVNVNGHKVHITHPDKLYWPALDYSKKTMVAYYETMAEWILPYLRDRPFVLNRYPDGIEGHHFYHKDMTQEPPEWVETLPIFSESNQDTIRYVLCQNTETLLWLANMGCIEMNPWNSCQQRLTHPDWMVIDLDPSERNTFEQVIETARVVHEILKSLDVPHYPKTSGGTGIHIYVPMGAQYPDEAVRNFGKVIATLTQRELPEITTLERSLSKRSQAQIYVDYLQNRFGQTLVAPYSLKPTPEATASAPLHWEEVKPGLSPRQFTLQTLPRRVKREGDLWKPVLGPGVDLNRLIESFK